VLSLRHSLHRKATDAKGFYAVYTGLIVLAAALVLTPGTPLGLLTNAVQSLAGVLLPSATVFLLLLCNDKAVLGPWVNTAKTNAFTSTVIAALVTLSIVLVASVMFPAITATQIIAIVAGCAAVAVTAVCWLGIQGIRRRGRSGPSDADGFVQADRMMWRMPPLAELAVPKITGARRVGLIALRGYLAVAMVMVVLKVVLMAVAH
jgi:hypothetical protein